ncbi:MAG TPA: hypothetical protein VF666_13010 [Pyrinomonadaceae bacterium]|jgi:hypothetical protein
MKSVTFFLLRACAMSVCIALTVAVVAGASVSSVRRSTASAAQDKAKEVKVSDGERKAAEKVQQAANAAAKLAAADEFLKKYPKSSLRPQVANHIASQITSVADPAQKLTLAESFSGKFTEPNEAEIIMPMLIETYVAANRVDDAFRVGAQYLEKRPDEIYTLTSLALNGIDQVRRNNPKFAQQSQQYALKAVELFEADKKPASVEAAQWSQYKSTRLPQLYQSLGIFSIAASKTADALPFLEKAAALDGKDPYTFWLISAVKNDEYQKLAELYKRTPAGPNQTEVLKLVNDKLDEIINLYARVIGLSIGKPQFQQLHDLAMQDMQTYYKYRHKSTDGMQQLIDKYKTTP